MSSLDDSSVAVVQSYLEGSTDLETASDALFEIIWKQGFGWSVDLDTPPSDLAKLQALWGRLIWLGFIKPSAVGPQPTTEADFRDFYTQFNARMADESDE